MRHAGGRVARAVLAAVVLSAWGAAASAGDCWSGCGSFLFGCGSCGGLAATDCGCGPRYWGEKDERGPPDACDGCARWRDCHGSMPTPEWLAPWQLPPGRGFRGGAAVGYQPAACGDCSPAGGCGWKLWPGLW